MLKFTLPCSDLIGLFRLENQQVADGQQINSSIQKATDSIGGSANDGFAAHVERGIDKHRATGDLVEALEEPVKAWISLSVDSLHASTIVDMGDGWKGGALLVQELEHIAVTGAKAGAVYGLPEFVAHLGHQQHIGTFLIKIEILGGFVGEDRGSKGAPAFAALDALVDKTLAVEAARVGKNGTVS
jgi:hypothetical protein